MDNASPGESGLPSELRLAYIIGTYPGISTTFIDREIKVLRRKGVDLQVISIRRYEGQLSEEQKELGKGVTYLLPVSWPLFIASHFWFALRNPRKYFGTLFYLVSRPHPSIRLRLKTWLHFSEGVYASYRLRGHSLDHIHAHFADRAAIVALVLGRLLDLPFSFTAHANDIYVDPVLLAEKLFEAKFVATCTRYNRVFLSKLVGGQFDHKILHIYHGLDAVHYQSDRQILAARPVVLAVGQLKEKKGFIYLVRACRWLRDRGYELECHIVGGGPLQSELEAEISKLSLEDTVKLRGALPHDKVIELYHQAGIFVLPAVLGSDGDRDGIPNVILEAMASGLPVISTRLSGIPEVIEDGSNGVLVPPGDDIALAAAIADLLDHPELGKRLARLGLQTVIEKFELERNTEQLLEQFITSASPTPIR